MSKMIADTILRMNRDIHHGGGNVSVAFSDGVLLARNYLKLLEDVNTLQASLITEVANAFEKGRASIHNTPQLVYMDVMDKEERISPYCRILFNKAISDWVLTEDQSQTVIGEEDET